MANQAEYRKTQLYNGNAAYEPAWQEETEEQQRQQQAPARHRRRGVYGISITGILGFALTGVMMVLVLMSYITYTQVADQAVSCRAEVEALTEQNQNLTAAYDTAFNMNDVNTYAQSVLGMSEPAANQIDYAGLNTQDSVAVYNSGDSSDGILSQISEMIASLLK